MGLDLDPMVLGAILLGLLAVAVLLTRPSGLFSGGRGRLPRSLVVSDLPSASLGRGAAEPVEFLAKKLSALGFSPADLPVRIPNIRGFRHNVVLVPFIHVDECTLFLMGIEQHLLPPRAELMLHIITPLTGGRRVETSTLPVLETLMHPPETVGLKIVLDAESVEEIYSRHRLALGEHPRADRVPMTPADWRQYAAAAYEAWLLSGVRSARLQLDDGGETYRVKDRPKSTV